MSQEQKIKQAITDRVARALTELNGNVHVSGAEAAVNAVGVEDGLRSQ